MMIIIIMFMMMIMITMIKLVTVVAGEMSMTPKSRYSLMQTLMGN